MPVTFFILASLVDLLIIELLRAKPSPNIVARRAKIIANAHEGGRACLSDNDESILLPFNRLANLEREKIAHS